MSWKTLNQLHEHEKSPMTGGGVTEAALGVSVFWVRVRGRCAVMGLTAIEMEFKSSSTSVRLLKMRVILPAIMLRLRKFSIPEVSMECHGCHCSCDVCKQCVWKKTAVQPSPPARTPVLFGAYIDWGQTKCIDYVQALGIPVRCWIDFLSIDGDYPVDWAKGHVDEAAAASGEGSSFVFTLEPFNGMDAVNDVAIGRVADVLRYALSKKVNPIVRLAHEMNGNWYPWGQKPDVYIRNYNRIIGKLKGLVAQGVEYMWAPNIYDGAPGVFSGGVWDYDSFFPDAALVDIVGIDIYHGIPADNNTPAADDALATRIKRFYSLYADGKNKKFAIAETAAPFNADAAGNESTLKYSWYEQLYSKRTIDMFPRLCLINWFEANKVEDGHKRDFRLVTANALTLFKSFTALTMAADYRASVKKVDMGTQTGSVLKKIAYVPDWKYTDVWTMDMSVFNGYTHLIWCFLWPTKEGKLGGLTANMNLSALVARVKANAPDTKIMVALGGWTASTYFSSVLAVDSLRTTFCLEIIHFLYTFKLNGVDIDWEFPEGGGMEGNTSSADDMINFRRFIKQLRGYLGQGYLMTITVSRLLDAYPEEADWVQLMSYDMFGGWSQYTDFNASLKGQKAQVDSFLKNGFPSDKLVLGIPFYGRGCNIANVENFGLHSPRGSMMDDTLTTYKALRQAQLGQPGWKRTYWPDDEVPTLLNTTTMQFITYDDVQSVKAKVKYAKEANLGGVMIWELSHDYNRELSDVIYTG